MQKRSSSCHPRILRAAFQVGLSLALGMSAACTKPAPKAEERPPEAVVAAPKSPVFSSPLPSLDRAPVEVPKALDWLLFGGGAEPLSNQVSLAQDLGFVRDLLAGPGLTLFASGPRAPLAVEDSPNVEATSANELLLALSQLFGTPGSGLTRYEPAALVIDGPSTADQVLQVLDTALPQSKEPLFVYAASHGDRGERASSNSLSLWGGWGLKVKDLAEVLDRHKERARPTRFVITACFGGGFADLVFVGAEPELGVREPEHCGVFAAPWDEEASGCDPNPDRRAQESYAIHFLHALSGNDRKGVPQPRDIDLNGDGQVSLLEAHTFARIVSRSFDNPTTTSERFLREAARTLPGLPRSDQAVALDPLAAPEEVAVIRALGQELELAKPEQAQAKLGELNRLFDDAAAEVEKAQHQADDAYYALRIAALERYPLLEHPWDPRTQTLLDEQGTAILELLTNSDLAHAHGHAASELEQAALDQDAVRVARARVVRLHRAYETLRLASVLKQADARAASKARGGARDNQASKHYAHYEALRRCENWVPRLRANAAR